MVLPDEATDASHALQTADERLYAQKYSRRGESERTMAALLAAISIREPELEAQRADISSLALDIGAMLGLRRDELDELERAAQLHDLGKLAVPDEILHKPGPLDEREWEFVRQQTIVGERILRASPALRSVAEHRPLVPRELGRERVSGRARRRGDPARGTDHPCLQRLRRDDLGPPVPRRRSRRTTH